ncbi:hypothetical protein F4V91_08015 [Neorhizobium galegae]|uniref:Dehydrogenase n=1 Tax=Neorhizobium galegae TaxID=399 RepID=A0A6A1TQC7_NEOGA|nr:hypothetical protein F4V91_08015 [Neorhizobium galegae]
MQSSPAEFLSDQQGPDVDAVLAGHENDARAAISTLLDEIHRLHKQLTLAEFAGSRGFARGWRPAYER